MTITYTQVNVKIGKRELWKREVEEGKMLQEMEWIAVHEGEEADSYCWNYRSHSYKDAINWMKEKEEEERKEEQE